MSWAKVKKINSDLSTPINIANLINHIDLVGSSYTGIDDPDLSYELYKAKALFMHPIAFEVVTSYALGPARADTQGVTCLCAMTGLNPNNYNSLSALLNNSTAMTAISNSKPAMAAISHSAPACEIISNSPTIIQKLDNSSPITVPKMTSYTTPYGVVRVEEANTEYEGWKAFDQETDTRWVTSTITNTWIEYEFAQPVWLYRVSLQAHTTSTSAPKNARLEYYSDYSGSWVPAIDIQFDAVTNLQEKVVASASGQHNRWRLFSRYNNGNTRYTTIANLQFYGK
ncbi:MAG: hypothetical protein ACOX4U_00390 [Anaerovoracaceae bacterium]